MPSASCRTQAQPALCHTSQTTTVVAAGSRPASVSTGTGPSRGSFSKASATLGGAPSSSSVVHAEANAWQAPRLNMPTCAAPSL